MTSRRPPQCLSCAHFRSPVDAGVTQPTWPDGTGSCDAFPDDVDAIPAEIWWNRVDHRQPHAGDHGIQWEAVEGATFPEYAMNLPA
jgi:hypothetical protein